MKEIIIDGEEVVNSTDWENKYKEIISYLDKNIFDKIDNIEGFDEGVSLGKYNKNEIRPILTPMQVTSALNRILRKYKPMNLDEAKSLEDIEYLDAFGYYCDVISYINKYLVYLPDKQTFCAFVNITTDVYNEMLGNPNYSSVFNSFEDSFIQSNFSSAQAGIVDGKTTVAKLQTKNAGHNLIKNPDSVTFNITQKIDKQKVNQMLGKYESIAKIGKK